MYRFFTSVVIASVLMFGSAAAATLQVTQGSASVNRGQGFETVNGTTTVNPGDVVNVPPGSNAQIVYPDGSIQTIQPGNVASVGPGTSAPAAAGGGLTGTTLAVGAAVVGVGVGVAVYAASKGASP